MKRLILSLLIVNLIAPIAFAQPQSEANDPNDQIKFERNDKYAGWIIAEERLNRLYEDPGPVKPPYASQLILHRDHPNETTASGVLKRIQASPLARNLSKEQREFLKTGFAVWACEGSQEILKHFPTWLYAMTEADARIMAEAYLDGLQGLVDEQMDVYHRRLAECQEEFQQAQKALPERQKQLQAASDQYEKTLDSLHKFDSDPLAAARQTISEMDKMLDTLEIELTGIQAKLKAITEYRKGEPERPLQNESNQVMLKLDLMFAEQMVELSGLEARKQVTEQIRARERNYVDLYHKWDTLRGEVSRLENTINNSQVNIRDITERLANPSGNMLPPKVYQNKVLIHRIKGSTAVEDVANYLEETHVSPVQYRGSSLGNRQALAAKFLDLAKKGHLRLEPSVVERLKGIKLKLEEATVQELLDRVSTVDWDCAVMGGPAQALAAKYLQYFRRAKDMLKEIDEGKLGAKPEQVKELKDFVKEYEEFQEKLKGRKRSRGDYD